MFTGSWSGRRPPADAGMGKWSWWASVCVLALLAAPGGRAGPCTHGFAINVIMLDDEQSSWSLKYVKGEILKAIELDKALNAEGKAAQPRRQPRRRFPAPEDSGSVNGNTGDAR